MTRDLLPLAPVVLAALATTAPAFAQGANDCASAQPIAGLGVFQFDNTAATTDGAADCSGFPVRKDVWFDWTSPVTSFVTVDLCGMTTLQTRVAVYDGTACPTGAPLACNSLVCTFQSQAHFSAIAGQHYLIRIGSKQVGTSGSGDFELEINPCDPANDDGFEDNDTCATATPILDGSYTGLYVSKLDPDYYSFDFAEGASIQLDILFTHNTGDIDTYLYDDCGAEVAQSAGASNDEQILYTNPLACTQHLQLRVEHWMPDSNGECNTYDLIVSGVSTGTSCALGTNYCSSTPNSTGSAAVMSATGSVSVAANDLVLHAGPTPNQPGLFFYSAGQTAGGSGVSFGNGLRCAGNGANPIFRLPVTSTSTNELSWAVDNTNPPSGAAQILVGSIFHFQAWFRDPGLGAGFDLSDGLTLTFVP